MSFGERPFYTASDKVKDFFSKRAMGYKILGKTLLGSSSVRLYSFDPTLFKDFVWRTIFSKTLTVKDYDLVSNDNFLTCRVPWKVLQQAGMNTLNLMAEPKFPKLNSAGVDIFIGQTPYPARLTAGSRMVIRYHDAVPVLMPHTINDKSRHQATHFYTLMANVNSGAWFACVSESARSELLAMFPQAESRSVTIHNILSEHYFLEESDKSQLKNIVLSSLYAGDPSKGADLKIPFLTNSERERFYEKRADFTSGTRYLLIVSTIEPRKNHARLFAAWLYLREHVDPSLKLVIVGTLGWEYKSIIEPMTEWIQRGDIFMLEKVPAASMRVLYRQALATVCPSFAEGFGFSGAESMACGGVVVASDLPVHREVYRDAAVYFNPYSTMSLVETLIPFLGNDDGGDQRQCLIAKGLEVARDYTLEKLTPKWNAFLSNVMQSQ